MEIPIFITTVFQTYYALLNQLIVEGLKFYRRNLMDAGQDYIIPIGTPYELKLIYLQI